MNATPYLLVDTDVLTANVDAMARFARDRDLALRPHAKTHKCLEIARLQLQAGAVGLTVATIAEAEVFAEAGAQDLFLAYPIWADPDRGARLRRLIDQATVTVGVDSVEGASALASQVPGTTVLVEVDSGQHRSGVSPDDAGALAVRAQALGLDVAGVFTFPGHSYVPGKQSEVARQEGRALHGAVAALTRCGLEARVVSGGSTPSASEMDAEVATEMRPGVYVFGDAQQWELGTMEPARVALTCVGTVVSHAGGNVLLDAGSKAIGADRAGYASGWGRLPDRPGARIVLLAEHHAVVEWDGPDLPPLGSRLRVAPNHVCTAVNLHDALVTTHGEVWPVAARGANT